MNKICTKCKIKQDISNFDLNKFTKDGYNHWCKKCKREYYYKSKGLDVPEVKTAKSGFKFCSKCGIEKTLDNFSDNGRYNYCKECSKLYYEENRERLKKYFKVYNVSNSHIEQSRKYHKNNREKEREYSKKYYNSEQGREKRKIYAEEHKEELKEKHRIYHEQNKDKINERQRFKYKNDIKQKLNISISSGIYQCLKSNNINKNKHHWEKLVNYNINDLIKHIESQFDDKMTWDNFGFYGWHIDHIIPKHILPFNSTDDENFKICWSLYNLRPLWREDNISRPKDGHDVDVESMIVYIKEKEGLKC